MLDICMIQTKNVQFTELIKAGGRLREFNFRRSQGVNDPMFTIDVANESGKRHYIFFRQKNGQWLLESKQLISWVEEILPRIEEILRAYK